MAATTPPKKKSVADVLKKASRATKSVSICLAGDLVAEYEELTAELERITMAAPTTDRLSGGVKSDPQAVKVAKRIQELEAEMAESTVAFRFRALPAKQWSDLIAKHPDPKKERLVNQETFVPAAIAACCVDPEGMDDPEQAAELFDTLSAGQQDELFEGAWEVNQTGPFVAKSSSLASEVLRPSGTSSPTA